MILLADQFGSFFQSKIATLTAALTLMGVAPLPHSSDQIPRLDSLPLATEAEVHCIITALPTKSCGRDPIPTWVLRLCLSGLLSALTILVNRSIDSGMLRQYRHPVISPRLKKGAKAVDDLSLYRPISSLT